MAVAMNLNYGPSGKVFSVHLCASVVNETFLSPQRHGDTEMHREDPSSRVTIGSNSQLLAKKTRSGRFVTQITQISNRAAAPTFKQESA